MRWIQVGLAIRISRVGCSYVGVPSVCVHGMGVFFSGGSGH